MWNLRLKTSYNDERSVVRRMKFQCKFLERPAFDMDMRIMLAIHHPSYRPLAQIGIPVEKGLSHLAILCNKKNIESKLKIIEWTQKTITVDNR